MTSPALAGITGLDDAKLESKALQGWPEPLIEDRGPAMFPGCARPRAWFNKARTHRYLLTRCWGGGPPMTMIGLNPSTAGAFTGDPTIGRVVGFARREGCGAVLMLNIYGLQSADPGLLREHPDPVGRCTDRILAAYAKGLVVAAWGAGGKLNGRGFEVGSCLTAAGVRLLCLGVTSAGHPRHPLYLRADTPLVPWQVPS